MHAQAGVRAGRRCALNGRITEGQEWQASSIQQYLDETATTPRSTSSTPLATPKRSLPARDFRAPSHYHALVRQVLCASLAGLTLRVDLNACVTSLGTQLDSVWSPSAMLSPAAPPVAPKPAVTMALPARPPRMPTAPAPLAAFAALPPQSTQAPRGVYTRPVEPTSARDDTQPNNSYKRARSLQLTTAYADQCRYVEIPPRLSTQVSNAGAMMISSLRVAYRQRTLCPILSRPCPPPTSRTQGMPSRRFRRGSVFGSTSCPPAR